MPLRIMVSLYVFHLNLESAMLTCQSRDGIVTFNELLQAQQNVFGVSLKP
jgi:hypothetical protein